ncbi:MAG TPA: outer membrane lipoprotein carrier protein LolA [bacterium]|nr:outer membrane lipoprotein carrier protein LolA [bacterium]HPN42287.1 outer membrane lipoprotein carrier protein LolA [bacterium]
MKYKLFTLFFILALTHAALSADKDANGILQQLKSTYDKYSSIQADFTQTFLWKLTEEEHTLSGKIWIQKGEKFKIDTPDNLVVNDGKALFTLNRNNQQVIINNATKGSANNPILKDFIDKYIRDYRAEIVKDDKDAYELKLVAGSEDEFIREIILTINKKTFFLSSVRQLDVNENTTIYQVENLQTNIPLTAEDFKIPGMDQYEQVDLR